MPEDARRTVAGRVSAKMNVVGMLGGRKLIGMILDEFDTTRLISCDQRGKANNQGNLGTCNFQLRERSVSRQYQTPMGRRLPSRVSV